MRIESVSGVVYRQPIVHRSAAFDSRAVERRWHDTLLVRVDTDTGITGWGEAFGHFGVAAATLSALETVVAPRCVGLDITDPVTLSTALSRTLHALGGGPVAYALSGVDIALWDLCGKARGVPVHEMLGGARTHSLLAYASLMRYAAAQAVAAECETAVARGYAGVKLHEIGRTEIEAAADVVGATPLMLDLNCPWRLDQATDFLAGLRKMPLHWVEEPIWPPENYRALATLRERVGLPMAAGENAMTVGHFGRMLSLRAVDFAQPSVTKIGGLSPASQLAGQAAKAGIALAPHSPYFGPGLCATLHLCAALAPEAMVEHLFYDLGPGPFGDRLMPLAGRFIVPDGPGLGMDPDPAWLAQHQVDADAARSAS